MPAIHIPGLPAIDLASKTIRSPSDSLSEPVLVARAADSSSTFVAIPTTYGALSSSPSPGVVAGIVLGSVAAFLLLLYVIYCILHGGLVLIPIRSSAAKSNRVAPSTLGTSTLGTSTLGTSTYGTRTVMSFRSRRDGSKRRRQSRSPRPEVVQVRKTSATTTKQQQQRRTVEPVIVSPPRSPSPVSTAAMPPRAVPTSEISGVSSMDEIVVEEENTSYGSSRRSRSRSSRSPPPPRRHSSKRYSPERGGGGGYRRDSSYYRDEVDSERYYSQRDSPGRRPGRRY